MPFEPSQSNIKTIKSHETDFYIIDGVSMVPRAFIMVSDECPGSYKQIIATAASNGWLRAGANMKHAEYTWEKLSE